MKESTRKFSRAMEMPTNASEIASIVAVAGAGFYFARFILINAWRGQDAKLADANALFIALASIMLAFVLTGAYKAEKWRARAAKFEKFISSLKVKGRISVIFLLVGGAVLLSRSTLGYIVLLSLIPTGLILYANMTKLARFAAWYLILSGLWTFFLALYGKVIG